MQAITTIFWDLDGTLVNSNGLYDQAIRFACNEANCTMVHRINDVPKGQTLRADFSFLLDLDINDKLLDRLINLAIFSIKANFNDSLIIQPTLELFNYFYKIGLQQSIVSNSNQELCDFIIHKMKLKDKCSHCFGIETVQYGKPHPQLYLHALTTHNISNSVCLAFEDSLNGINAAKAANLTVIGVGLSSNKANPDYCWDIHNNDFSKILQELSKSYEFG